LAPPPGGHPEPLPLPLASGFRQQPAELGGPLAEACLQQRHNGVPPDLCEHLPNERQFPHGLFLPPAAPLRAQGPPHRPGHDSSRSLNPSMSSHWAAARLSRISCFSSLTSARSRRTSRGTLPKRVFSSSRMAF